jgi:urea carboxylase
VTGSVWQIAVEPGQRVQEGQELLVIEAMKMEIPLQADEAGEVVEILCSQGGSVGAGQTLLILKPREV